MLICCFIFQHYLGWYEIIQKWKRWRWGEVVSRTECIIVFVGKNKFHGEALDTLYDFFNQSKYTVRNLRNATEYLFLTTTINVIWTLLPSDVMDDINKLNVDMNSATYRLSKKTNDFLFYFLHLEEYSKMCMQS